MFSNLFNFWIDSGNHFGNSLKVNRFLLVDLLAFVDGFEEKLEKMEKDESVYWRFVHTVKLH